MGSGQESINSRIRTVNSDVENFMLPRFGHNKNPDVEFFVASQKNPDVD
jgi:hypothetical protein